MRNVTVVSAFPYSWYRSQGNDFFVGVVARREPQNVCCDRFHDRLVLGSVFVPVVYAGDTTLLVIGDPVHRITAEPEPGHSRGERPAQIVRCDLLLHAKPRTNVAHRRI